MHTTDRNLQDRDRTEGGGRVIDGSLTIELGEDA